MVSGGYWSTYWYHGKIYGTEIARGLDVFELVASDHLTENEIAAAEMADQGQLFNPQQQFKVTWPHQPVVARAYIDQLERSEALSESLVSDLKAALDRSESGLAEGGSNPELAASLESLATAVGEGGGNATTVKRRKALADTLTGIAERLSEAR